MNEEKGKGWAQLKDDWIKYECQECGFSALPLSFIPDNKLKELKDNKIKDLTDEIEQLKQQLKNQNGNNSKNNNLNTGKKRF